jgi:hypothetical protein
VNKEKTKMQEVFTPDQIGERWDCDAKTVRGMLNSGILKGFKIGKKLWRVRIEHIEEYELCQNGQSQNSGENLQSLGSSTSTGEKSGDVIPLEHLTGNKRNATPRLDTRN